MNSRRQLYAMGMPFGESCTRQEAGRRIYGGGGGGSSSSSSSANTTTNVDKRQVVDTGSVGVSADSSSITVNATDNGAVNSAIALVQNAGAGALDAYKALLAATVVLDGQSQAVSTANSGVASQLIGTTQGAATAAGANSQTLLLLAGAAVAGYLLLKGKG